MQATELAEDLVTIQVRRDEAIELGVDAPMPRCKCGHLWALHNFHCCQFCNVGDCKCSDGL